MTEEYAKNCPARRKDCPECNNIAYKTRLAKGMNRELEADIIRSAEETRQRRKRFFEKIGFYLPLRLRN